MKKLLFFLLCALPLLIKAQSFQSLDTIKAPVNYENIYSKPVASDSLTSSFIIFIKKEVKKHKHAYHSEHVYVLEGEGEMLLDKQIFKVKKGDIIFIPENTIHSLKVLSKEPVKVLSVQSPFFDGKDRIFIE
jgi:mannose-6-phosphate isomerase-like protein (cupin superfamily)